MSAIDDIWGSSAIDKIWGDQGTAQPSAIDNIWADKPALDYHGLPGEAAGLIAGAALDTLSKPRPENIGTAIGHALELPAYNLMRNDQVQRDIPQGLVDAYKGAAGSRGQGDSIFGGLSTGEAANALEPGTATREHFNAVVPPLLATAASLALPIASPALTGLAGVGVNAAGRAGTEALSGGDTSSILHAANPGEHIGSDALAMTLPFVGRAVGNALSAKSLSDLSDYDKALSLNPEARDFASPPGANIPENPPRELSMFEKMRAALSGSTHYLKGSDSEYAQAAGQRMEAYQALRREMLRRGKNVIDRTLGDLTDAQLEDLTALRKGQLAAEQVDSAVVDASSAMSRHFYQPIGNRAAASGMMTKSEEAGLIPFALKEGEFSPDIPAQYSPSAANFMKQVSAPAQFEFQRLGESGGQNLTNARDIAQAYLMKMARKLPATEAFGPVSSLEKGALGDKAQNLLNGMIADNAAPEATMWKQDMQRLYSPLTPGTHDDLARWITSKAGNVYLGQAALTSFPQLATNVMRNGIGNTLEGAVRYATDPAFRQFIHESGALSPAVADYAVAGGTSARSLTTKTMAAMEKFLRGAGNSGAIPYSEKLIAAAEAGDKTAATVRQLAEMGVSADEAQGGVTADLLRRMFQANSDTSQLQAGGIGEVGNVFHEPIAKVLGQFQNFPMAAARHFQDAVGSPMVSGIMGSPTDLALGAGRLARWAPGAIGAVAAKDSLKDLVAGRDFNPARSISNAAETVVGMPARPLMYAGRAAYDMMNGQPYSAERIMKETGQGYSPSDSMLPPALGLAAGAVEDPLAAALVDAPAAYDPTGVMALLRGPLRHLLREARK